VGGLLTLYTRVGARHSVTALSRRDREPRLCRLAERGRRFAITISRPDIRGNDRADKAVDAALRSLRSVLPRARMNASTGAKRVPPISAISPKPSIKAGYRAAYRAGFITDESKVEKTFSQR